MCRLVRKTDLAVSRAWAPISVSPRTSCPSQSLRLPCEGARQLHRQDELIWTLTTNGVTEKGLRRCATTTRSTTS